MKISALISLLSILTCSSALAQGSGDEEESTIAIHSPYRMSIVANGLIPHPISNSAFRRSFDGIYDATLSVNFEVYKGFNIGLMGKNSGFQTPADKIASLNTKEQYNVGGLRLSYDYFINKIAVFTPGINFGQCYIHAYEIMPITSSANINPNAQGSYIEPELTMSFYTEEDFAIGFNLSYEIVNTVFNPYALALEQHGIVFTQSDLSGVTQNISIGFHFVYSFWKKKRK